MFDIFGEMDFTIEKFFSDITEMEEELNKLVTEEARREIEGTRR